MGCTESPSPFCGAILWCSLCGPGQDECTLERCVCCIRIDIQAFPQTFACAQARRYFFPRLSDKVCQNPRASSLNIPRNRHILNLFVEATAELNPQTLPRIIVARFSPMTLRSLVIDRGSYTYRQPTRAESQLKELILLKTTILQKFLLAKIAWTTVSRMV